MRDELCDAADYAFPLPGAGLRGDGKLSASGEAGLAAELLPGAVLPEGEVPTEGGRARLQEGAPCYLRTPGEQV